MRIYIQKKPKKTLFGAKNKICYNLFKKNSLNKFATSWFMLGIQQCDYKKTLSRKISHTNPRFLPYHIVLFSNLLSCITRTHCKNFLHNHGLLLYKCNESDRDGLLDVLSSSDIYKYYFSDNNLFSYSCSDTLTVERI